MVGQVAAGVGLLLPLLLAWVTMLKDFYVAVLTHLPPSYVPVAGGLLLMFFGGEFYTLIAASEAWRVCGGEAALGALRTVQGQLTACLSAAAADDAKEGGPGAKAAAPGASSERVKRKALLMARAAQPEALSAAAAALWMTAMGILATLRLRMARTLVLGASISKQLLPVATRHALPALDAQLPEELRKWGPTLIDVSVKAVILVISAFLSKLVGAAHAALRGGQLVAAHGLKLLKHKGLLKGAVDDKLVNAAAIALAALGVLTQVSAGFRIPFPLSLFVLPLTTAEWALQLSVGVSAL